MATPVDTPESERARWFAEEVQPHEPSLRAALRRSMKSLADVDDLIQEAFIRILGARDKGPIRSSKSFLFAVARNAMHDLIRRRSVAAAVPITETASLNVIDDRPGVVDLVIRRQELELLAEAVRSLPERCRQVFLLRKIQNLSQREIASRLSISENTVETLVAKGVRRCADYLRARGVGPGQDHAS
jgi:RNA polymerase sigma factor (sigma-70 family)